MKIVTDRGADFSPDQIQYLEIHFAPLRIELEGKTYISGVDLSAEEFYQLLGKTDAFPTTSQPSAGEFAALYRKLAETDPEILSIHISSGLSGTIDSARAGAAMVPEAKVTIWDTKILSCPEAWLVEAAARAAKAGWELNKIISLLEKLQQKVTGVFTLSDLRYLIHGGRISHITGLVASLLNIKPIITVDKVSGKYIQAGREITMKRAIHRMAHLVESWSEAGEALRVQLLHGFNPEGVEMLRDEMLRRFSKITWLPTATIAPVLGAHTGPSMVGMAVAPMELFTNLP
ncbi:MAG TPA: DegV family protein [Anaerolineaceae bacterium]|nr:DegV family protein [Anaerolineaceae bacterium]HOD44652.1 DegV family protein [Anaerolineaceae bacterium]HOH18839.1 DegV family protein [Anaerolineaceae bacterium]